MIAPRRQRDGWYLRVSITERCNLRCRYCLPENARFPDQAATAAELRTLIACIDAAVGLRKLRLTGGEPTLSNDLVDHVRFAKELGLSVGLTTNGTLLEGLLDPLHQAGLDLLNVSLDAVDEASFGRISRRSGVAAVMAAIRSAVQRGFRPVKVNCVALHDTDFAGLLRFALDTGVHLRFIELMPIGEARSLPAGTFIPASEIRQRLRAAGFTLTERSDRDEATARVYAIGDQPVEQVSVGFITTVTAPFCATCDRLRLTSRGRLHVCLNDEHGIDLLGPLRAGFQDRLLCAIREAVAGKSIPDHVERHGTMAAIGG